MLTWWDREYSIRISARRCTRIVSVLLVAAFVTFGLLYLARGPVLRWVGRTLVSEDPLQPADAIVVLGGGTPGREIEGAALYHAAISRRLVLALEADEAATKLLLDRQVRVEHPNDLRVRILRELGVPNEAVLRLPVNVESTFDEAVAVIDWAAAQRVSSLLIVTSRFHSQRVRLTYDRVAAGRGIAFRIRGVDLGNAFDPDDWWRSHESLESGLYELQKLIYYRVMY